MDEQALKIQIHSKNYSPPTVQGFVLGTEDNTNMSKLQFYP